MDHLIVRQACESDAPTLARFRRLMFEDIGWNLSEHEALELEDSSRRYFEHHLAPGRDVIGFIAEDGILPVGCGVIQLRAKLPQPGFVDNEPEAYVDNMWTEPRVRRRGVASLILEAVIAWCRERGVRRLTLNASDEARALYTRFGFTPTNGMRFLVGFDR